MYPNTYTLITESDDIWTLSITEEEYVVHSILNVHYSSLI